MRHDVIARPDAAGRVLPVLWTVLALATPFCLCLGVRGFAPVVGIAGLICLPFARPVRSDWAGVRILAALVLWAALSVAWSPAPNLHVLDSAKALSRFTILHLAMQLALCTAFIVAMARLDRASARKALNGIVAGALVASAWLIEEAFSQGKVYLALLAYFHQRIRLDWIVADLSQGGYVIAVMAWPLVVMAPRRGWPRLALGLMAFVPLSMALLRGVAPTVALAVSLPVFFLTLRSGQRAIKALAAITAGYMLVTPLVMLAAAHLQLYARFQHDLPPSWADRLRIWSFVAEQFVRAPLRGAGLDASRTFPGLVPLHPHNAALQLWYELGLPGALLGIAFWLWLWRRIADCARRSPLHGAAAAATATVYLVISALSFGLWQEWWLCVGAVGAALCVLLGKTLAVSPCP